MSHDSLIVPACAGELRAWLIYGINRPLPLRWLWRRWRLLYLLHWWHVVDFILKTKRCCYRNERAEKHKLLKTNPIKKWVLALLAKNARDAFPSVSWSIQPTAIDRADFERKQHGHDASKIPNALQRSRAENAILTATIILPANGCLSAWFPGCFAGDWRGQVPCLALLLSDFWSSGIRSSYDVSATLSNFCLGSWS